MVRFTILPKKKGKQAFKATSLQQLRGDGVFWFNWSEPQVHFQKLGQIGAGVWEDVV